MPTYVLTQAQAFADFAAVPNVAVNPLRAHISGPHAQLIRYSQATERPGGLLGFYDNQLDTEYNWPDLPANSIVDLSYVKLWCQNALLQYFQTFIGQGGLVTKLANFNNRIQSATYSFASNGTTYPRSAVFKDRNVKAGDIAKVRGISGGSSVTLWTYVKSVQGATVDSTVDAASSDAGNATAQSATASVVQSSGPKNCITAVVSGTLYNGLASGHITETYDVLVTTGSAGDDLTTATVRVISGSGTDDVAAVHPAAVDTPFEVGTRGLTLTFSVSGSEACSDSASLAHVDVDDLAVGQRWHITVQQDFVVPVPTSGGVYDNDQDTTYIVTVSLGGKYTDTVKPQITVSTTNGIDVSGPTTVTGASVNTTVGTYGVTIEFTGTSLCEGDRYYIVCTGHAVGPMQVLELGHSLDSGIADGSELDLTLFILEPILQISKDRVGFAPTLNWTTDNLGITVNSGIIAYDVTYTSSGVQEPLPLVSESTQSYGILYLETRYWLSDLCQTIGSISSAANLDTLITGALDPDNPLKWGVSQALANSNGIAVLFTSVCDPSSDSSWANVLEILVGLNTVYGLVPLTTTQSVLNLYRAHVDNQSTAENDLWRVLWVNLQGIPEIPIVSAGSSVVGHTAATTSDGNIALGTVSQDPSVLTAQFTILQCTSANANFIKNGVLPGDIVRLLFTTDGFGNTLYSEFVVDSVQSEDQLTLQAGPDSAITVAALFEVWRNLTADEEAAAIAAIATAYNDSRVRATWPDTIVSSGVTMAGYFLNCALAGLASGILPHQPMNQLQIVGYTGVPRTTGKFNNTQLNTLAAGGTWIVTQDVSLVDGSNQIFTRHAFTTGNQSDINAREEMIVRNVDSISYRFMNAAAPFIGISNITTAMQQKLQLVINGIIIALKQEATTTLLGPQLVDATITRLSPHVTLLDHMVLNISITVPFPFNALLLSLLL